MSSPTGLLIARCVRYPVQVATRFEKTVLGPNDDGRRLDRVLRKALPGVPLSRIYRALRSREISLNGRRAKADTRVADGDTLEIAETLVPDAGVSADDAKRRAATRASRTTAPPLSVVFENDDVLVVAKARGTITHGDDSLETQVAHHLAGRLAAGISFKPGPVHRLDRNTSGLVVFGRSLKGAQAASRALEGGTLIKRYVALMDGAVEPARWEDVLERDRTTRTTQTPPAQDAPGRVAVTHVEPIRRANGLTVALVRIETGRTHQIRAQASAHGHPLTGDRKYGSANRGPYLLHAGSLTTTGDADDLGFSHLWVAPPPPFERRLAHEFDRDLVAAVRRRLEVPPRD